MDKQWIERYWEHIELFDAPVVIDENGYTIGNKFTNIKDWLDTVYDRNFMVNDKVHNLMVYASIVLHYLDYDLPVVNGLSCKVKQLKLELDDITGTRDLWGT